MTHIEPPPIGVLMAVGAILLVMLWSYGLTIIAYEEFTGEDDDE